MSEEETWQQIDEKFEEVARNYQGISDLPLVQASELPETMVRAINLMVSPLSGTVWLGEQLRGWIGYEMKKRFEYIPPDRIQAPDPSVAGPLLGALRYNLHREELRDMYANLLATAMDRETAEQAHPAYVEIIKQLTPDEARAFEYLARQKRKGIPVVDVYAREESGSKAILLRENGTILGDLAGTKHKPLVHSYIENLCRLRLAEYTSNLAPQDEKAKSFFERVEEVLLQRPDIKEKLAELGENWAIEIKRKGLRLTSFGKQFFRACIANPEDLDTDHQEDEYIML